jgi:hypothetical protein
MGRSSLLSIHPRDIHRGRTSLVIPLVVPLFSLRTSYA